MFIATLDALIEFLADSARKRETKWPPIANEVRARLLEMGDECVHAARLILKAGKRLPGPDGRVWCESLCVVIRKICALVETAPPRHTNGLVTLGRKEVYPYACEALDRRHELGAMLPDPAPSPDPLPLSTIAPATTATSPVPEGKPGQRKKPKTRVNAKMLETLLNVPDSYAWSARKWAQHLRCSVSSVAETEAWKKVIPTRQKQERDSRPKARESDF